MGRGRPAKCPYCGGSSINKGFRKTKTMGKRQIKLCKACGRKFTPQNQKSVQEGPQDRPEQAGREEARRPEQAQESDPTREFYQAAEPAEVLGMMFPPPEDE